MSRALQAALFLPFASLVLLGADCVGNASGDGGPDCGEDRARVCDGTRVMEVDRCANAREEQEQCPAACHLGRCVDCAPGAGTACDGNDVRTIDTCGVLGDVVQSCASGCKNGACVDESCAPGAGTTCVGDAVYDVDSCGNVEGFAQSCADGCAEGACQGCVPDQYITCYDGDVYTLDSCFELGQLDADCPNGCDASGGNVQCADVACTPNGGYACFAGDLHYIDSCGGVQPDLFEDCPNGCDDMGCLACQPVPSGFTCVGNDRHVLLGGCPGAAPAAGERVETCANGCSQGACLADGCVPDVGTVCQGGNVHSLDSCDAVGALVETCPSGCTAGACDAAPAPDAGSQGDFSCVCNDGCQLSGSAIPTPLECAGCFSEFFSGCDDFELCRAHCAEAALECSGDILVVLGQTMGGCGPDCGDFCAPSDLCALGGCPAP